jgi:uncharacterized membrane protein
MQSAVVFIISLLIIDSIWLKGASRLHAEMTLAVQNSPLKVSPLWAAGFYLLAALAFKQVIIPLSGGKDVFKTGALLGLLMYGTFDFTNKAIFSKYPSDYAIMDTAWGAFAMGAASYTTVEICKKLAIPL